jgi:hypothetical protein
MGRDAWIGYVLLAVGIAVLLFTLYEAYGIFGLFMNGNIFAAPAQPNTVLGNAPASNISESGLVTALLGGIISAFPIGKYFSYFLGVIVLGVFASIGYKFAKIGVEMIKILPSNKAG